MCLDKGLRGQSTGSRGRGVLDEVGGAVLSRGGPCGHSNGRVYSRRVDLVYSSWGHFGCCVEKRWGGDEG